MRNNTAFKLLFRGSSVSMLGSRLTTIAYPMLVLYLTGSPVYAGIAVCAATVPSILVYLPAGVLVDRWDPKRTMLASEFGRGVAIAIVVASLALHRPSVPLIIGLAMLEEILEVFSTLAERRYIQVLVEPRDVSSALVRTEARTHVAVLAGRPLGGLLFELRPIFPFLADMVSFIASVSIICVIRNKRPVRPARISFRQLMGEVRVGVKWLFRDDFGRFATPLWACTTLISQALIMVFISDARTRQLSSATVGIVLAASGLGGALGAVIGPRLRLRIFTKPSRITIQLCIWSVALLVLALAGQSWQIPCMAIVMALLGFTGAMSNLELDTFLIRRVPTGMFARVTSISRLLSFAACALGPALGGILIGIREARFAVDMLFALTFALALGSVMALEMPKLRARAAKRNLQREAAVVVKDLAPDVAGSGAGTPYPVIGPASGNA
jgi:MFS family permease